MNIYEAIGKFLADRPPPNGGSYAVVFEKKSGELVERRIIAYEASGANQKDDQFYTVGPSSTGYITYWDVDKERPGMFHMSKLKMFDGVYVEQPAT